MKRVSRFGGDEKGATAVEFALVLPVMILMILGVIEGNRYLWSQQAVQEATSHTARCMAIGTDGCETIDGVKAYAEQRASKVGVKINTADVTALANQNCNGTDNMSKVVISVPYASPLTSLIPVFPKTLNAEACFPNIV